MKIALASLLAAAALPVSLAACSSSDDPCKGVTGTCVAVNAGASETEVQTDLINATAGTTIAFAAGTYDFDLDLSLDVGGVTIQGEGEDSTILSWKTQTTGAQGLLVMLTTGTFDMHDIALHDAKGDILKIVGASGVHLNHVDAEYTDGPQTTNGAYALYPVQSQNVLIENCTAKGASDTGIYVGQSMNVIIRNNDVEDNVAGIESENTNNSDIYSNTATHNAGGILVFNLPGLEVENAGTTRVFMNTSTDNNTTNFAPSGNIVGMVPTGSGFVALAAHNLEVFQNTFSNEDTMNLGIASYTIIGNPNDPNYNPYPDTIYVHDNTFTGTSTMATGPLGGLIDLALGELQPPTTTVPDMIWDGVVNPAFPAASGPNLDADHAICLGGNGDADWADLEYPTGDATKASTDMTAFMCTHPSLSPVTIPGS